MQNKHHHSGKEQAMNNFQPKKKTNIESKGNCVLNALLFLSASKVHTVFKQQQVTADYLANG